jgi:hypothetical protein
MIVVVPGALINRDVDEAGMQCLAIGLSALQLEIIRGVQYLGGVPRSPSAYAIP